MNGRMAKVLHTRILLHGDQSRRKTQWVVRVPAQ